MAVTLTEPVVLGDRYVDTFLVYHPPTNKNICIYALPRDTWNDDLAASIIENSEEIARTQSAISLSSDGGYYNSDTELWNARYDAHTGKIILVGSCDTWDDPSGAYLGVLRVFELTINDANISFIEKHATFADLGVQSSETYNGFCIVASGILALSYISSDSSYNPHVVCCDFSGASLSMGSPVQLATGWYLEYQTMIEYNDTANSVLIWYRPTKYIDAVVVGTISGMTISLGAPATRDSAGNDLDGPQLILFGNSFVYKYRRNLVTNFVLGEMSGNSVSWDPEISDNSTVGIWGDLRFSSEENLFYYFAIDDTSLNYITLSTDFTVISFPVVLPIDGLYSVTRTYGELQNVFDAVVNSSADGVMKYVSAIVAPDIFWTDNHNQIELP